MKLRFNCKQEVEAFLLAICNKKAFEDKSSKAFSTQDDSVLELFYKDLVLLYDLKETLKHEGLSDYVENPQYLKRNTPNQLLHIGS